MPKPKKKVKPRVTRDWRKLVEAIESGNEVEVVEAAKKLGDLSLRPTVKPLVRLLQGGRTPYVREMACYALAWMDFPDLSPVFIKCLRNKRESEHVRGQAAEALGMLHGNPDPGKSRLRRFRTAENALINGLSDPSPTVRFWCCFALGGMGGSKRAIEGLSRLKRFDRALCPGAWYVREEASDALDWIHGRDHPNRIPVRFRPKSRR
jgi:HEAT repeat protein